MALASGTKLGPYKIPQLPPWLEGRNHIHPAVHRVQDAIAADLTKPWSMRALARIAGASDRHLSRLFHEHVGMSIPEYSNRLRVAYAQQLLRETRFDMERVAEQSGFSSTRQLRRAWDKDPQNPTTRSSTSLVGQRRFNS